MVHDPAAGPAGLHGFNGYKSGTLPLAPGSHLIEIDYMQVHELQRRSWSATDHLHCHIICVTS